MSFGEALPTCFRKYATFSGRARPSEYWWWVLFNVLVVLALSVVAGGDLENNQTAAALAGVAWLGLILPSLAVSVRRLHDTGRSGWFLLLPLIPLVGGIILLVFQVSAGDPGPNKYGDPPDAAVSESLESS